MQAIAMGLEGGQFPTCALDGSGSWESGPKAYKTQKIDLASPRIQNATAPNNRMVCA